jgi:hypothetical protein
MTNRDRFRKVLNFEKVDRLPYLEWAVWWDKTIDRWRKEGLPDELQSAGDIREYFGLDTHRQWWIGPMKSTCQPPPQHGQGIVSDMDSYLKIKEHLFPVEAFDKKIIQDWAAAQTKGDMAIWISLDGFFWFPRSLLGIERHLCAFYDQPELMHQMNQDLLEFNLRVVEEFCQICAPDFMTFGEDMSYNKGSMLYCTLPLRTFES